MPFGGNCFNFGNALPGHRPSNNDLKDNYIEAQNTCNKMGGHLATPTNIYQMAFVAANSYSISQQFWLGIKSTSMQDKSFHWDGIQPEILTYSNWDSISPRGNSGNNKDRNRDIQYIICVILIPCNQVCGGGTVIPRSSHRLIMSIRLYISEKKVCWCSLGRCSDFWGIFHWTMERLPV